MINMKNDRHDVLVNSLEKVSREYPELLLEREVFMKLLSFVKVLTGNMRSAVLKTLDRFLEVCKKMNRLKDIVDIAMAL